MKQTTFHPSRILNIVAKITFAQSKLRTLHSIIYLLEKPKMNGKSSILACGMPKPFLLYVFLLCRSQPAIIFITHFSFFNLIWFNFYLFIYLFIFFFGGGEGRPVHYRGFMDLVHISGPGTQCKVRGLVHVLSSPVVHILNGRLGLTLHVIAYNHIGVF